MIVCFCSELSNGSSHNTRKFSVLSPTIRTCMIVGTTLRGIPLQYKDICPPIDEGFPSLRPGCSSTRPVSFVRPWFEEVHHSLVIVVGELGHLSQSLLVIHVLPVRLACLGRSHHCSCRQPWQRDSSWLQHDPAQMQPRSSLAVGDPHAAAALGGAGGRWAEIGRTGRSRPVVRIGLEASRGAFAIRVHRRVQA